METKEVKKTKTGKKGTCPICRRTLRLNGKNCSRCCSLLRKGLTADEIQAKIPLTHNLAGVEGTPICQHKKTTSIFQNVFKFREQRDTDLLAKCTECGLFKTRGGFWVPGEQAALAGVVGTLIDHFEVPPLGYPVKSMIPIWTTSDGNEWGNELAALKAELDICHTELNRRK